MNMFTPEHMDLIRDCVNKKLNQDIGAGNNSNVTYQKLDAPEQWLTQGLQDTMLASPANLDSATRIRFRLNALAAFFGSGGLARPSEYACRDIVALALLDVDEATLMSEGVGWVRAFKALVKPMAKSHVDRMGCIPEMESPASHKENNGNWYNNMYTDKEPGNSAWVPLARLVNIRGVLGCRSTRCGADAFAASSRPRPCLRALQMQSQAQFAQVQSFSSQPAGPLALMGWAPPPALPGLVRAPLQVAPLALTDAAAPGAAVAHVGGSVVAGAQPGGDGQQAAPVGGQARAAVAEHIVRMKAIVGGGGQAAGTPDQGESTPPKKKSGGFPGTSKVKKHQAKNPTQKTPCKRPAAAPRASPAKGSRALAYPGPGKRGPHPLRQVGGVFSPNRFRVMVTKGDRVDQAFSHLTAGPQQAWVEVCKVLRKNNPGE